MYTGRLKNCSFGIPLLISDIPPNPFYNPKTHIAIIHLQYEYWFSVVFSQNCQRVQGMFVFLIQYPECFQMIMGFTYVAIFSPPTLT